MRIKHVSSLPVCPWQVMNKWLSLQASAAIPGNVERVKELMSHPAFTITEPNKVSNLHMRLTVGDWLTDASMECDLTEFF